MAEALREAYAELFVIKDPPTDKDKALIEGKFKSAHNVADRPAELMSRTFLALAKIADFSQSPKVTEPIREIEQKVQNDKDGERQKIEVIKENLLVPPSLHYNIQIHLPSTKDVEVYSAIFKSLKEHLLA
jgi:hypothetical protein